MASRLEFNFSQSFDGVIWGTFAIPQSHLLFLEVRQEDSHEVRFSAFDYGKNEFLWKDMLFKETWWIGLTAATPHVLLLHQYMGMENPDAKSLIAFHVHQKKILWQHDHFSFDCLDNDKIHGHFIKEGIKQAILDVNTGEILENVNPLNVNRENIVALKPFQYVEGHPHFETVKSFLTRKMNIIPVFGVEYLEYSSFIFISYHVQEESLANYLVVITEDGAEVLCEKLGVQLKGLGLETFFILSGCLFFVRNKCALVSFRIV